MHKNYIENEFLLYIFCYVDYAHYAVIHKDIDRVKNISIVITQQSTIMIFRLMIFS